MCVPTQSSLLKHSNVRTFSPCHRPGCRVKKKKKHSSKNVFEKKIQNYSTSNRVGSHLENIIQMTLIELNTVPLKTLLQKPKENKQILPFATAIPTISAF